jgi:hypothetical protein
MQAHALIDISDSDEREQGSWLAAIHVGCLQPLPSAVRLWLVCPSPGLALWVGQIGVSFAHAEQAFELRQHHL